MLKILDWNKGKIIPEVYFIDRKEEILEIDIFLFLMKKKPIYLN